MKKALLLSFVSLNFMFGACFVNYNSQSNTCSAVANSLSTSMRNLTKNFIDTRKSEILEPSNKLNEQIIKYNQINGKVYAEQQAIMNLDNAIANEMNEQIFLLEKLSKLKEQSLKAKELLIKSE